MNTVNASMGFSGFQLHLGQSPYIIFPTLTPISDMELQDTATTATTLLNKITEDVAEARNNLLQAKIFQASYMNTSQKPGPHYSIND